MSATPDSVKNENAVNIEIDGVALRARRGDMVIEAADAAGIEIPRFCYHKKLSVAANCRMCLVEVEKVPKPLPACATPVTEGMKVYTRSPKAIEAQKGTMEFLLINHPLDCPICDQGGECDLQEMSIGYGAGYSEYQESKRVVKDKDIGPLIETEMTRCIHCTRCVRFGEEVAGLKELGATGRGENMRIGTYIEKAVSSEMSGNMIDLCPVGALTSKPFRYTARAWEMQSRSSVAPHDCIGSNLTVLVRGHEVMRVDPRENESINETWISDRDRFSYEALSGEERLRVPMVKRDGRWEQTDWKDALEQVRRGLRDVLDTHGADQLGTLVSPSATLEEMHLAQQLTRGLGSSNIDHRLRQLDVSDQEQAPVFPWLGQSIEALEDVEAALLVGSYVRKDQPIAAHRLRKAALKGGRVMFINPAAYEFNFPVAENVGVEPAGMERRLAAVARAALEDSGAKAPSGLEQLLAGVTPDERDRRIAGVLREAANGTVLLGIQAFMHPAFSTLRALAQVIADATGTRQGYLSEGANAAGAWLAGAVPHRAAGGAAVPKPGLAARDMLASRLKAYLLLNVEPDRDAAVPAEAVDALKEAPCVVALTAFTGKALQEYADVMLPVSPFSETSGTFVNAEGRWQSFAGTVPALGEARPAWKVLRVLGNVLGLDGFQYVSSEEVRDEVAALAGNIEPSNDTVWVCPRGLTEPSEGLTRIAYLPVNAVDNIVRRADSLQRTEDAALATRACIAPETAQRLGLNDGDVVLVRQDGGQMEMSVRFDDGIPPDCVLVPVATAEAAALGMGFGPIGLERVADA